MFRVLRGCKQADRWQLAWFVGVTIAPRQEPTIARTLASIRDAGWRAVHVQAEPRSDVPRVERMMVSTEFNRRRLGAWPNFLQCLQAGIDSHADWLLICQDDVLLSKGLRARLAGHNEPAGVVSLYTMGPLQRGRGWRALDQVELPRAFGGALAIAMNLMTAKLLVADPPGMGSLNRTDHWVARFAKDHGLPLWVHTPSHAEHIGETSTIHTGAGITASRRAGEWIA